MPQMKLVSFESGQEIGRVAVVTVPHEDDKVVFDDIKYTVAEVVHMLNENSVVVKLM